MNSQPFTNVLNTIQQCTRSPNKKDEITMLVSNKGESQAPQEQDNSKRKRGVAIDDRVRIYEIHTRTEYTNDEVRDCWYSPSELKLFRSDCCTMARAPKAFLKNTGEDYCARGLEHLTTLTCKSRKLDISKAMFAVFIEQEMHSWTTDGPSVTPPDELIREAYLAQCRRSKVSARLKGLSDQAEAACDYGKNVCSNSRIVRSWKGWLLRQKVPEMSKESSKSHTRRRRHHLISLPKACTGMPHQ